MDDEVDEMLIDVETTDDIDALLSSIDGFKMILIKRIVKSMKKIFDLDNKINSGVFPLPVKKSITKVRKSTKCSAILERKSYKRFWCSK